MKNFTIKPPPNGVVPLVHRICEFYKVFHVCFVLFPRENKNLGLKIENNILEILELVLTATYLPKTNKSELLLRASNKVDLLKYLIRLAHEVKSINLNKYLILEKEVLEIGKMLGGWIKSI